MRTLIISTTIALLTGSFGLAAEENYVSIGAGANSWSKTSNMEEIESGSELGYIVFLSLVHDYGNQFRSEVELSYRYDDIHGINYPDEGIKSTGDGNALTTVSIFANGEYEFHHGSMLRPFIMGGIGVLRLSANDKKNAENPLNDDTETFGAQLGLGARIELTNTLDVQFRATYLWSDSVKLNGLKTRYETMSATLGLNYRF
jgi:opacity protein-like surface antigen